MTKAVSAFEWGVVVGARRTSLNVLIKNCNAAGFFHTQQFPGLTVLV
jgi:hypothetical protein